jgi:hypothetical protein
MPRSILALGLAVAVAVLIAALPLSVEAADLEIPMQGAKIRGVTGPCDVCGCLRVIYARHREVLTTYGVGFDPRNYDTAEPLFYPGRVRAYPRYFTDGASDPSVWRMCNAP